jgi:hypothetical protein
VTLPDLVIEALADSEASLRERVQSLEQDVEAYRGLAVEAIHALHYVTRERDRLRLAARRDVVDVIGNQTDTIIALRSECDDLRIQLRGAQCGEAA